MIGLIAAPACHADLSYNPEHDEALANLKSVDSANMNMHYQCGKYSLFISIFATEAELNGKDASVTGKITSDTASHDISDKLKLAISRDNVLTGKMTVACNAEKGAFLLEIVSSKYAKNSDGSFTEISVFSDGTVEGARSF